MTRDTLIGTLIESIFVYSIPDGRLLHQGRTGKNPNGIADFRANKLAVPGHKTGSVHVSPLIFTPQLNGGEGHLRSFEVIF